MDTLKKMFLYNARNVTNWTFMTQGCHGCDHMIVGYTTTCTISAHCH